MNRLLSVIAIQFNEKYTFHKIMKMKSTLIKLFYQIVLITVGYFILKSSFGFIKGFLGIIVNQDYVVFLIIMLQLFQLIQLLGYTTKTIFLSNDLNILLNLPIKNYVVLVSKTIMIWIREMHGTVFFSFLIILATSSVVSFTIGTALLTIFTLILMSTLTILVSIILSIVILKIRVMLKGKFLITYSIAGIGFVGFSYLLFIFAMNIIEVIGFNGSRVLMTIKLNEFIQSVSNNFWLSKQYYNIMFGGVHGLISIGFILLIITALVYIVFLLGKHYYFELTANANLYFKKKQKKQKSKLIRRSAFKSIIVKDLLNIYREPGYVFQYLLLPIMMPFMILLYNQLFSSIDTNVLGGQLIVGANVMLIILLSTLSNVMSSTGFSRAGKNAYLVKVTPVSYKEEVISKIMMNVVISSISIITTFIVGYFTNIFTIDFIFITLFPVILINFSHIMWSYEMDIIKPAISWHNEDEMLVNTNITKSVVLGIIIALVFGLYVMLSLANSTAFVTWGKLYLFAAILFVIRYALLKLKYSYYLNKLEM